MKGAELIFAPLGGCREIGMNLNAYGYGPPEDRRWIVVDVGVTFGNDSTPGVDLIMPDPVYLESFTDQIEAIILTHAHEDHIGAIGWLWPKLRAPIYEDVVQEVFLSVWRKAASYRSDRGDVPGWLYTITRNKLVDLWRRKGAAVEDPDFDFTQLLATGPGAEAQVVSLTVRKALSALGREQREALELAYFGGLTYEETAERLALPLGTLKSRIRAGLAAMRAVLSGSPS